MSEKHSTRMRPPSSGSRFINFIKFLFLPLRIKKWIQFTIHNKEGINFFAMVTKELLKNRRGQEGGGAGSVDFLQLVMDSGRQNAGNFAPFTDKDIIANSIIFFAAGFDTTATLLTYTTYCLAMYPDVQEKLFREISDAVQSRKVDMDYEMVTSLEYLDCFVSEVLRMFTPVIRMPRVATADYKLVDGAKEIFIPKGTPINLAFYAVHYDADYWPRPEVFDPERFSAQNRGNIRQFTFLPFGDGPRNCIGMRFALLEAKLAVARLVTKFKFTKCGKTDENLDFSDAFVLLHAKRVIVGVTKREQTDQGN